MTGPDVPAHEAPEPPASLVQPDGTTEVPITPVPVPAVEIPDVPAHEAPEPPASDVVIDQ